MQSSTMVAIDDLMDMLPRIGEPLREVEVRFCLIRCDVVTWFVFVGGGGHLAVIGVCFCFSMPENT